MAKKAAYESFIAPSNDNYLDYIMNESIRDYLPQRITSQKVKPLKTNDITLNKTSHFPSRNITPAGGSSSLISRKQRNRNRTIFTSCDNTVTSTNRHKLIPSESGRPLRSSTKAYNSFTRQISKVGENSKQHILQKNNQSPSLTQL